MTTPTKCGFCGTEITEANPMNDRGWCEDTVSCVERWSKPKDKEERDDASE